MGHRSFRERSRKDDANGPEDESREQSSGDERDSAVPGRVDGVARSVAGVTAGRAASVRRSATGRRDSAEHRGGGSDRGYISYDPGPDRQALGEQYGIEVREGQARKLQRLEREFGSDRVSHWAEEGMTVGTMGKPRDMQAFRKRQEERPEEVPTDIERRNEASLQRNAARNREKGPAGETGVPDLVRSVVSSPGRSMDETVQREMESKMGGDFGDVQIHTGPKAAAAADSINARAFTVGNHVAFNAGEYQPERSEGKRVLAHELTHVRQQTEGAVSMLPTTDANLTIDPDPTLEQETEAAVEDGIDDERTVRRLGTEMHVQPQLKVSSPNDPAEREAERVAKEVMHMSPAEDGTGLELTQGVHKKASSGGSVLQSGAMERIKALKGGGKPLSPSTQPFFESRFGRDFGGVRVHTGPEADGLNQEVHARAFTTGRDIFFRSGEYAPGSSGGRRLLAHELTHVVQQRSAPAAGGPTRVSSPEASAEVEADRVAKRVTGHRVEQEADVGGLAQQEPDREKPHGKPVEPGFEPLLQRSGDETENGESAADTRPWNVPFDGGTAETYAEAIDGLDHIDSFIFFNRPSRTVLPDVWNDQLDGVQAACSDALPELEGKSGQLDPEDTTMLEFLGSMAEGTWDEAVETTQQQVKPELEKLRSDHDLDGKITELQEKLHFAFTEGAEEEHIKAIQETLTAVKELKGKVDKVIGWAKEAADLLEDVETLEFFNKLDDVSRRFGTVLDYADQATEATKIIYNLATAKGASGDFKHLNAFETGLDAIDLTVGFAKNVTLLGALWENYYSPMTRECLRLLRHIAKLVDKQRRQEASLLIEEFTEERVPGGAPKIPEGYDSYFPGGQAVFSYMWHVFNTGKRQRRVHATSEVKSYFVDHADQFNAGVSKGGVKLRTESTSKWYDPTSWGDETAVNLDRFVTANEDMIWAMLYGGVIPQDILA